MCNCKCSCERKPPREGVKNFYKYELTHKGITERFKTRIAIRDKYGISYSTQRNLIVGQNRSDHQNSKYNDYSIKKIKIKIEP